MREIIKNNLGELEVVASPEEHKIITTDPNEKKIKNKDQEYKIKDEIRGHPL